MATYAIVNSDNKILNMIEWNGIDYFVPPSDCTVRLASEDDTFNG